MDLGLASKALGIGLAVAAPVGPMAVLVMQRTLQQGRRAGLIVGAGIAAADSTYAAIAALGLVALTSALMAATAWISVAGSLVLIALGLRIALRAAQLAAHRGTSASASGAFLAAYGLTLANPPTILFFAAVFASMVAVASTGDAFAFALGVFAGSMLWWLLLTYAVNKSARLLTPRVMRWVNRLSGAALAAFGCLGLARVLWR